MTQPGKKYPSATSAPFSLSFYFYFPPFTFFIFSSITNTHLSSPSSQALTWDLRPLPDSFRPIWNTAWGSSLLFWFPFWYDALLLFFVKPFSLFYFIRFLFFVKKSQIFSFFGFQIEERMRHPKLIFLFFSLVF